MLMVVAIAGIAAYLLIYAGIRGVTWSRPWTLVTGGKAAT